MFTYENGLMIAFLIWFISIVLNIVKLNSRTQKNLKKIGKRIGFFGIVNIDYTKQSFMRRTLKFVLVNIILPLPFLLLSWVYVGMTIVQYLYFVSKDFGAPQSVKEFRWKLKNVDLSFDQLIKEMMILEGQDLSKFPEVKEEYERYLDSKKGINTHNYQ